MHYDGRCSTLTLRMRNLKSLKVAPGSCTFNYSAHLPTVWRGRLWQTDVQSGVRNSRINSQHDNIDSRARNGSHTSFRWILKKLEQNTLHIVFVTWCISLPCGLLEQLKVDDPAMLQHFENTRYTLWSPLRSEKVWTSLGSLTFEPRSGQKDYVNVIGYLTLVLCVSQ